MKKMKVKFKEAITIADLKNYENHRQIYKQQLENSDDENEAMELITDYHNAVVSTVEEYIVTPYLKSSIDREKYHQSKSVDSILSSGIFTIGTFASILGLLATNEDGFLMTGVFSFALATASIVSGLYHFVKSIKEKNNRLNVIDTWEFDKTQSPVDVLDFCYDNDIQLLTSPFSFELSRIRDNRKDKTDLVDPLRKNRFKKEAKKLVKEGLEEREYQYYKYMADLALQSAEDDSDEDKGFLNGKEEFINNKDENE